MNADRFISIGGLVVAAVALWRSGRARVIDLRTRVRQDAAELGLSITELVYRIHTATQSRASINAAAGMAGGPTQAFTHTANEDLEKLSELKEVLDDIEPIAWWASYGEVEAKVVRARIVRSQVEQLLGKYDAAAADDRRRQEQLRAGMITSVFGRG